MTCHHWKAVLLVLLALSVGACSRERGERCNPSSFEDECGAGLTCVYPTGPMSGVAYCCALDEKGNISDTSTNCQPKNELAEACMLDLRSELADGGSID